jgi:hypothetical protein
VNPDESRKPGWMLLVACVLYACIAVFFFRDALFTDRVQVCSDVPRFHYPWALEQVGDGKPRNLALADQCLVFYPWFRYTGEMLRQGELPLWTPHVLGGAPYMGNLSTAIFYPLNLLVAVMPVTAFFLVQSLFKVFAAGLLTYLFLRSLKVGYAAALFGGAMYACSGYNIVWIISHLTSVSLLMPALFWSTEIFLKRRNGPSVGLIAVLLGLQFLGAQPETSLCVVTAWGIYTLFRIRHATGLFNRDGFLRLGYIGIAGVLAMGLVLYQLWPFFEYLQRSWGLHLRSTDAEAVTRFGGADPLFTMAGFGLGVLFVVCILLGWWMLKRGTKPLQALGSGLAAGLVLVIGLQAATMVGLKPFFIITFLPDIYGNPLDGVRSGGGPAYSEFAGGYAGVLVALLAVYGMVTGRRRSPLGVLSSLFLLSFGTVYCVPFIHQFVRSLPGFDICQPGRIVCVTAFMLAVLAAFGLDRLLRQAPEPQAFRIGLLRGLGAAAVIGIAIGLMGWRFVETKVTPGQDILEEGDPRVELTAPEPGSRCEIGNGLELAGTFGPGVVKINFFLNGLWVGYILHDDKGRFSERVKLPQFREGYYRLAAHVLPEPGEGAKIGIRALVLSYPKTLTGRNLVVTLVSLAALIFLLVRAVPRSVRFAVGFAVAFIDLALFGASYNTTSDPAELFPDNAVTDFLSSREGTFRILPENAMLQPSTNYLYGYQIIRGYDGLELPEYHNLINCMMTGVGTDIHSYNSRTLDYESPVFDLLGIRYVVSLDDLRGIPGFRLALDGTVKVYENTGAQPRAFIAGNWVEADRFVDLLKAKDFERALDYMKAALQRDAPEIPIQTMSRDEFVMFLAKHFNFREWALVENRIDLEPGGRGEVEIVSYGNERILLKTELEGNGLLIVTDNWFPGWKAFVDGEEREILRADITFRAIPLESGSHTVELIYEPRSFYDGIKGAILSLVLLCFLVFIPRLTRPLRLDTAPAGE